jgi:hypothetical protein
MTFKGQLTLNLSISTPAVFFDTEKSSDTTGNIGLLYNLKIQILGQSNQAY